MNARLRWIKISKNSYAASNSDAYPWIVAAKRGWQIIVYRHTGRYWNGIERLRRISLYRQTLTEAKDAAQKWCDKEEHRQ